MIRRRVRPSPSCPLWMLTYGDLMTLLLACFVMLVGMSTLNRQLFHHAARSINQAFGIEGKSGGSRGTTMVQRLQSMTVVDEASLTPATGGPGQACRVQQVRGGLRIVGDALEFDPGSAELRPVALRTLSGLAREIGGQTTEIEVRGHAFAESLSSGGPIRDMLDLSYARAKAIAVVLTGSGVQARRIRLTACGTHDPVALQAGARADGVGTRCVEILIKESLARETLGDLASAR
jgi:chemotaxis protein MotB